MENLGNGGYVFCAQMEVATLKSTRRVFCCARNAVAGRSSKILEALCQKKTTSLVATLVSVPWLAKRTGKKMLVTPKSERFFLAFIPLRNSAGLGLDLESGTTNYPARWTKLKASYAGCLVGKAATTVETWNMLEQQCRHCVPHTLNAEFVLFH